MTSDRSRAKSAETAANLRRQRRIAAIVVAAFATGVAVSACAQIEGIDNLQRASGDASVTGTALGPDGAALGDDGTGASTDGGGSVSHFQDGGVATLVDGDVAASDCTPDPAFCGNVCGDATDNCGQVRHCSSDCGQNNTCNTTTHKCECVQLSNLCDNRCGTLTDNCAKPADCGSCPSDGGVPLTCTSNACGCMPDTFTTTCGAKKCGTAVNNCNQTVFCGGTVTTPSSACTNAGDVCLANDTCCTPDNATPCAGKCGGQTVTNNCGQTITCPSSCPSGEVCTSGACCTPTTAACNGVQCGTVTNNCGQALACPDTCASPYTCGGGGQGANTCGCTPTASCGDLTCGAINDGCGNTLQCDTCADICGTSGICNATTHVCRCTGCPQTARPGALGPDMVPCQQP